MSVETHFFNLSAGRHARYDAPMVLTINEKQTGHTQAKLTEVDTDRSIPCQLSDNGSKLAFILPGIGAREERKLKLELGAEGSRHGGVKLTDNPEKGLIVEINGAPLTVYRYLPKGEYPIKARPFFYPLIGPGGIPMTRNYPMRTDVAGEKHDHPHHRGMLVAFGDVNGTDNWSEEKNHAYQTHQRFNSIESGPVFGRFTELLHWEDKDHKKVCEELRTFTAWNVPSGFRVLDLNVTFVASDGEIRFGDTKEGGIISIRVPTTMDGERTGTIENAAGGVGEGENWGRAAYWVDYHGLSQDQHVGIAIMDHPMNLRHPSPWHVRDYGLFAANPFAHSYYKASLLTNGSYVVPKGEKLSFNYRVYLHRGDPRRGDVAAKWNDYAFPPAMKLVEAK
jgi:hypothetical protein